MLMLLRIAAEASEPFVVLTHLLRPRFHHGLGHSVRSTQGVKVSDSLVSRRCIQVPLAGDARIATLLTLGRLLQDNDLAAQIMSRDRRGHPRGAKSDDDDIGFHIPFM